LITEHGLFDASREGLVKLRQKVGLA
jgi:hypothetical protein